MKRFLAASALAAILAACATPLPGAGEHAHGASPPDSRQAVRFPQPLRDHTLANMRDHLLTLQRIQDALASGALERAAELAESRLGLSSLEAHGAHDVAKFMPPAMQEIGTGMHKAASRFAIEATSAGATGDLKAPLAALSAVTAQCVACHAAYRLE